MADTADVLDTLVAIVGGVVFPNGAGTPSIAGPCSQIAAGWPLPNQLSGTFNTMITVYPSGLVKNTTRYLEQWTVAIKQTPTLSMTGTGQVVTLAGAIPPASNPHNVVIFIGHKPYVYGVQPSDTLATIATALATLIGPDVPGVSSSGATITLPAGTQIAALRIGVTATSANEVERQEQQFCVSIWAPKPALRTAFAAPIALALKKLSFINLPDLTAGRIRFVTERWFDTFQKQGIYRRDLVFSVEYGAIDSRIDTQITQEQFNVSVAVAGVQPAQPATTFYI